MAEIKVEHRKSMSMWTWLIPLLIVIALLWWFLAREPGDDVTAGVAGASTATIIASDANFSTIMDLETRVEVPVLLSTIGWRV